MTTLVALHDPQLGTFIGSDSRATLGKLIAGSVLKWVVHPSGWAAAAAGPLTSITLMRESADELFQGLKGPYDFSERLKAILHRGGFMPGSDGDAGPMSWGLSVMLAHPSGVWDFDCTLSGQRVEDGRMWASGSGQEFALGASEAIRHFDLPPMERISRALSAATALDAMSGGDLFVHHLVITEVPATKPRVRAKAASKAPAKKVIKKPAARATRKKR